MELTRWNDYEDCCAYENAKKVRVQHSKAVNARPVILYNAEPSSSDDDDGMSGNDPDCNRDEDGARARTNNSVQAGADIALGHHQRSSDC